MVLTYNGPDTPRIHETWPVLDGFVGLQLVSARQSSKIGDFPLRENWLVFQLARPPTGKESAMNLLSIAHVPPIIVSPDNTVMDAVDVTLAARVGAVAVVEKNRLTGIFTERDMMYKVVHNRMDPDTTLIREVMTSPVIKIVPNMAPKEVLELMLDKHIRHLPISEDGKEVLGMLSIRNILQFLVTDLKNDLRHMEAFIGADSIGG